jgi:hypothetical protein
LETDEVKISFSNTDGPKTQFTTPQQTTLLHIGLTLKDTHGDESTKYFPLQVRCKPNANSNCPPVPVAQARIEGPYIILDGSKSSDPDPADSIVEYHWSQVDNTGIKADDIRGTIKDRQVYVVSPRVSQDTTLSYSHSYNHNVLSESDDRVDITIHPCSQPEINKVTEITNDFKANIDFLKSHGFPVAAQTLDLWMSGQGAILFPNDNPRPLDINWLKQSSEVQRAIPFCC